MSPEPELVGAPPAPVACTEGHGPGQRDGSWTGTDPGAPPGEHGPYPVFRLLAPTRAPAGALVAAAVWAGGLCAYAGTGADPRGCRISRELRAHAGLSARGRATAPTWRAGPRVTRRR